MELPFRAPPLFTWMLVAASSVTDIGMVAISLIRYALLAMIFGFTYLTARRLISDARLAALATFSFAAIYVFGYYSHHDLTHTTVLSAFLAASWYIFVRLCETPMMRWYLALGLCFGLGMLGKWNFVMFAVALPLACLVHPAYRGLILNWRIVPAALLTAAIVLPPALSALRVGPATGDDVGEVLGRQGGSFLYILLKGTADLALGVLTYPQPFLVIFLIFFGAAAWRGFRAPEVGPGFVPPVPDSRLVGTVIAIAVGLHWLLVPATGATHFAERLLQPALQILPVYLFMLVEQGAAPVQAIRPYALAIAAVAAVALLARVGIHVAGADYCRGTCRTLVPFQERVRRLSARQAFRAGARSWRAATMPAATCASSFRVPASWRLATRQGSGRRPRAAGQCLAVWTMEGNAARDGAAAYLTGELGVDAQAPHRDGVIAVAMQGSRTRSYRLYYRLYDGPQGDCR